MASKGLTVQTFKGLSTKRMASKGSKNFGKRLALKQGDTVPVQMLTTPDEFLEYEQHQFQEGGRWKYVPCLGPSCPLCQEEDQNVSKTTYRFSCNVYNLKERKVEVLEGPKDLATRIFYRYERKPEKFLKSCFDISKMATQPVSYDVSVGDDDLVKTDKLVLIDLEEYIQEEARRYHGDDMSGKPATLEAPEDFAEDEDGFEKPKKAKKGKKKKAKA